MLSLASEQDAGRLSTSAFQFIEDSQQVGAKLQNHLAYPGIPCLATQSTLTLQDLVNDPSWEIWSDELDFHVELSMLGLSSVFPIVREYDIVGTYPRPGASFPASVLSWSGAVGRGVLSMSILHRKEPKDIDVPFISQICQAVCQQERVLQELRHVFMSTVINVDTLNVVDALHGTLPGSDNDLQVWRYGSLEYQALLGTPLGKVVAHFLLDAFDRGTRRISRIVTWYDCCNIVSMRFDIDVVDRTEYYC